MLHTGKKKKPGVDHLKTKLTKHEACAIHQRIIELIHVLLDSGKLAAYGKKNTSHL